MSRTSTKTSTLPPSIGLLSYCCHFTFWVISPFDDSFPICEMEMLVLTLLVKRSLKYIGKATFRQYEGKSSVFAPGPASLVLQLTAGVWGIKRTCMDNISRYHECLQFTRSQKNPSSPGKLIFLLVKCKSSPCRGMRFLLSMQIYLGNTGSRGPYWIAGLLGLGSPFAGSKCLSYKLPLDINIQKTFGPALAQVKALT